MLRKQLHERWKSQICLRRWSYGVKYGKKDTANYNPFEKINLIKGLWSPCQKCMDKFFDPYFKILRNWANHFEKPQKNSPKILSLILEIFRKENLYCTLLKHFLRQWKTCFIPSVGIVETSYSDGFYPIYVPNFINSWVIVLTG